MPPSIHRFDLEVSDPVDLMSLCGEHERNLNLIAERLNVQIRRRGNAFAVEGDGVAARKTEEVICYLLALAGSQEINPDTVHLALGDLQASAGRLDTAPGLEIHARKLHIRPRGRNQRNYVEQVRSNAITFGAGPAGTGKTWLAVACAVEALDKEEVDRIILVRPAVEAGERLGFLPGDLSQKIDPYLRPLYDALYEMLGFETVGRMMERNIIELAPLAYMRGRTLNHAFIILDESQNSTPEQMKMFLTRLGFGSRAVITGDPSQVDLPRGQKSGLVHALDILGNTEDIGITRFSPKDVVRHPLVQHIIEAYEGHRNHASND
jgi:phosphate starvation-inducible PhoH-like protein